MDFSIFKVTGQALADATMSVALPTPLKRGLLQKKRIFSPFQKPRVREKKKKKKKKKKSK